MTATISTRFVGYSLLSLTFLFFAFSASSQTIKGKVIDAFSGEPLAGATVTISKEGKKFYRLTGFDGSFAFRNTPPALYQVTVTYIGYKMERSQIACPAAGAVNLVTKLPIDTKNDLLEVIVNGQKNHESDEFARRSELTVSNIMNIVSAKTIEVSPDITIGNVLQRVSGVSMIRSGSGDGQYAIIRGLATRYTYTSINGIIMPSPDAQTRSVPLDMFPADMVQRVEVTKALTPNVEANAIGGATNLVMKDAPAHLTVSGNLATGVSTIFLDQHFSGYSRKDISFLSPTEIHGSNYVAKVSDFSLNHLNFHQVTLPLNLIAGLSIGNQLFHHKLGWLIGGSYIREYRGGNTLLYQGQSVITNPYPGHADPAPDTTKFTAVQNRQYSYLQSRFGLHAKLDFAISPDHYFNLYGLFLQLDDNQHRYMVQNGLSNGSEIDYYDRVQFVRKGIKNISLNGSDKIVKNLKAEWTLSYSDASSKTPDWVDLGRFKDSAASIPVYVSNPLTNQWLHSHDIDKSGYLNFRYTPLHKVEMNLGGMYRNKQRGSFYNTYSLSPILPGLSRQLFTNINSAIFSFNPASNAIGDTTDAQTYTAAENISATYLSAKITVRDKLQILAGVREETTDQSYVSNISPALPGKTGKFYYTDILPSLHLKYSLTEKENLRLSYFAGISRPNIYELVPTTSSGDFYTQGGNDSLKHTTSQNIDFRYENFFTATNYFLAGAFYKRLVNPVESAFGATTVIGNSTILQPTNPAGAVTDYGIELVFTKFIRKFGLSGNYTYIHSAVTTPKLVSEKDGSGNVISVFPNQTRPMQGQANHIANLSLLFKDPKSGLDAQLSFVYTGKRISVVSPYYGLDLWQRATSQLDFSLNKTMGHHIVVFVKATNLLNNNLYQDILNKNTQNGKGYPEQSDPNRILVQRDVFKQTVLGGLRYRL
jgi:Carboxypeptidase regulatory-like domain/TonB-dependent Receptor Plug Domain